MRVKSKTLAMVFTNISVINAMKLLFRRTYFGKNFYTQIVDESYYINYLDANIYQASVVKNL
jgi:hypothetical protein